MAGAGIAATGGMPWVAVPGDVPVAAGVAVAEVAVAAGVVAGDVAVAGGVERVSAAWSGSTEAEREPPPHPIRVAAVLRATTAASADLTAPMVGRCSAHRAGPEWRCAPRSRRPGRWERRRLRGAQALIESVTTMFTAPHAAVRRAVAPRRPKIRAGAAALLLGVACGLAPAVPAAQAAAGDITATRAYVEADYRLMRSAVSRIPTAERALQGVLAGVRRDCPRAAAGSPQNALSTQLSNEVIGAMVTAVVDQGLPLARQYIRSAERLRWSNGRLTSEVQGYVGKVRVLTALAPPALCADVRAWAASGFQSLTASTEGFDRRFMPAWVAAGELPQALSRYEQGGTRALARRAAALESTFGDFEARAVETWGRIMNALELWP